MIKCKCKVCNDRFPGCHSSCSDYKEYKELLAIVNSNKREDALSHTFVIESCHRARREMRNK